MNRAEDPDDVLTRLYKTSQQLQEAKTKNLSADLSKYRALYWARNYHMNSRSQRMTFKDLYYLLELYKEIETTPRMVVEKSVQCFPANTRIITPTGYRPIGSIIVGDLVLTHKGRYRKVKETMVRAVEDEPMTRVISDCSNAVTSTNDHPYLGYAYSRAKYHYTRYDATFTKPAEWVAAGKLDIGSFLVRPHIPIPACKKCINVIEYVDRDIVSNDGIWFKEKWGQRFTKTTIDLTYSFGRLCGLYLAEGWVNATRLCFGFHYDESELEMAVRQSISELLQGVNPAIHSYLNRKDTCRRVFVSSYTLSTLFRKLFGGSCESKQLPEWMLASNGDFLYGVFIGLLEGDGNIGNRQFRFTTVSKELAYQFKFLASMFGYLGKINKETPLDKRQVYRFVSGCNNKYTRSVSISGKHKAVRIKKIESLEYSGSLYNLSVEGDESYVAEDYVVHNCGLSELFIIQSHVEAGEQGMTVMYVLPKYELRNRFVNNRIYKLHKRVGHYHRFVVQAETKVHRTSLMHFGMGTLAYVGSNVSDEFIEIPVDSVYVDEKDRCNQANLLLMKDRLTASPYRYMREIGNPTTESFGIDERYTESSQGQWHVQCPHCNKWFVPDFWKHVVRETSVNVFMPRDVSADHDMFSSAEIGLVHDCGGVVDRLQWGRWEHAYPTREWKGFRVSKLFSKFTTLREMYRTWVGAVGNDLKTQLFYNSDLGLPFTSKGAKITRALLESCCRPYEWPVKRVGNEYARLMGVDVGANLHIVLRERVRTATGMSLRLLGAWVVPGFAQLAQILREWKPMCCVIDAQPEIHKVMELKEEFGMVWSSRFQFDAQSLIKQKDKRELRMDRTAILDYVRQGFELQTTLLPTQAEFIEDGEYYAHMQASTRILEADEEKPEKSRFIWKEGSRPDHFFLAEAYCLQAGMLMPEHGVFDFFDQEAKALGSLGSKLDVHAPGSTDAERERLAHLKNLTPTIFLNEQFNKHVNVDAPKPLASPQRIEDVVKFMHASQGYVDIFLVQQSMPESEDDILKVLTALGFTESKIRGQFTK